MGCIIASNCTPPKSILWTTMEPRSTCLPCHWHEYEIAKCLKCGLCLEVCPNYTSGANFFGSLFANDCYLVAARNKAKAGEIKALYDERFGRDCSKALSCMDVCPAGISTIASMARLNR